MISAVRGVTRAVAQRWRGIAICAVAATAATFLSDHYRAPVMLMALLIGMALSPAAGDPQCAPGVAFGARSLLRLGIALLGARITFGQIADLGVWPVVIAVGGVAATILVSVGFARLFGFSPLFGVLTGGATAICGASATLALSAVLPAHPMKDRATTFTVVGVSLLSTAAMVVYPVVATRLGLSERQAGLFLGGAIHDVAQVIGAGYSLSTVTGDVATVMKLVRVGMLAPVVIIVGLLSRRSGAEADQTKEPLLPWFAIAFLAIAGLSSTGLVPPAVREGMVEASRWCLVLAISALGMRTNLASIVEVGVRPFALLVIEAGFLAVLVLVAVLAT